MNREQRRKLNKKHKVNYSANDWALIELYAKIRAGDLNVKDLEGLSPELRQYVHFDNEELVPEGTPVKLAVDDILTRPRAGITEKFLGWVKDHSNSVFHVTREQASDYLVCLKEDVEECNERLSKGENLDHVPWLWDIYSDFLYEKNGKWVFLHFLEKDAENA